MIQIENEKKKKIEVRCVSIYWFGENQPGNFVGR